MTTKLLGILVGISLASACASAPKPKHAAKPPPPPAAPVVEAPPPEMAAFDMQPAAPPRPLVTLGLSKPVGRTVANQSQKQLDAYLTKELGGETVTKVFDTPNELADAIVKGEIEAAWMTPMAYVRASSSVNLLPVVKLSRGGYTNYRSVFFVKAGTKAKKLSDMKGKKLALLAAGSTSGRLYPLYHLKKLKLDPAKFFKALVEVQDHKEVCQTIIAGKADVGVTLSDEVKDEKLAIADGCREAGLDPAKFTVLERTDPIPNDVIAFRADVSEGVRSHVRDALVALAQTPDGEKQIDEIFQANGFAPADDADFTVVREINAEQPK